MGAGRHGPPGVAKREWESQICESGSHVEAGRDAGNVPKRYPSRPAAAGRPLPIPARRVRSSVPDARCPSCEESTGRHHWTDSPGQAFPFVIVCPRCGAEAHVRDVDYRLGAVTPPATNGKPATAAISAR
jgi:hypothetical protein